MDSEVKKVQNIGWCLTAREPTVDYAYRWTIEDFKSKMENFKLGQQLESSQFVICGLKMCINLYPNGRNEDEGGFVSLFLRNDNSIQLEVMCEFTLGVQHSYKHNFSFNKINPNSGYGFPKMYSHDQILSKNILDGDTLEIRAVITFKGKAKNISHQVYDSEEVADITKVGEDLFKAFENQEFCDFEIAFGEKSLKCHKVVLGSRSPVFKAMFQNDMEESVAQKVEPKTFDFDTTYHLLKFIYKGYIEADVLEKFAESLFKAADFYAINDLKRICEKILMRQLTLKNMLEYYVLGDMYKASELKSTSKNLIVINSKELLKQKDWKSQLNGSSHLVFEILEEVISKADN